MVDFCIAEKRLIVDSEIYGFSPSAILPMFLAKSICTKAMIGYLVIMYYYLNDVFVN